ncbi:hypothetical protein B0A48_04091 [Cryoendolithus antarcticus]|uniref:Uncharacterized protein n=1 Tax=Cryoendolithus antarcticus TaxID=1507870 RepID=A0A1V8THR4_9PEZI|nr:hypothetical protein B0A48_04091 [Cryoendolithus antarcticus]
MNRFLNRKKTDESVEVNKDALAQLSSPPPVSPGLKKSATSRWKKNKRVIETKPEINLATVLPSSDNFRTSLLMPNLSARFSMLREQDDPNSMLGKASDDSVLQPSRRSRMFDFGAPGYGLSDIAEVRSINSSIRPPFAHSNKHGSYASEDGYGSENESMHAGSVMSRSRPGEGNVLFGGRQKVYMIPKSGAQSQKSLGKVVYEDDMAKTAFQKHRQRERDLQEAREAELPQDPQSFDFGLEQASAGGEDDSKIATPNDSARDLSHSPSQSSYDKKRSTTSSTTRSEARSSTAATSEASQPATNGQFSTPAPPPQGPPPAVPSSLERSNTRGRRLYEQGLDQHMYDQQTSALTRLNSIQKQRTLNSSRGAAPFLHSAKSETNIHARPPPNVYALRAQSPPPLAPLTTFGSLNRQNGSPITSGPSSPMSPQYSDNEDSNLFAQALEPGDRGKATAMGAFNKPKAAFDEKQYLERQIQLQRSNSGAVTRQRSGSAMQHRMQRLEQAEQEQKASIPSGLTRSSSLAKKHDPSKAFSVFQNAANRNQQLAAEQQTPPVEETRPEKPDYPDTHRTFFGNISADDSEEESDEQYTSENPYDYQDYGYGSPYGAWQPSVLPSVSEHPALRSDRAPSALLEVDEEDEADFIPRDVTNGRREGVREEPLSPPSLQQEADVESPTLGPGTEGISHMMQHLRSKSTTSSNYPQSEGDQVPELPTTYDPKSPQRGYSLRGSAYDTESRIESTYTNSNPWDLDETESGFGYNNEPVSRSSISPLEGIKETDPYMSSRVTSQAETYQNRHSEISQDVDSQSWQNELGSAHARNASTATQQERAAFDNELAARRNAIQETMKRVETEQARAVSPVPSTGGAFKAFGLLRSKTSRDSIADGRHDAPSKAMRMLGIGAGSTPASSASLNAQYERGGMSLDISRARGNSGSRSALAGRILQQSDQDGRRERDFSRARGESDSTRPERSMGRSPATSSEAARARSRSNSAATNSRSRSRTGPYRDDLEKAMVEGTGTSASGIPELSPMLPQELTPRPSPDSIQQGQFDRQTRSRSNSSRVNAMTNYFDSKNLQPLQTAHNNRLVANGMSPNVYTPTGMSVRSTPAASPYSQMATPPISGANTPVGGSFAQPMMPPQPALRNGPLRKKTISKSDISEPIKLLSSTSNVDTVDLPAGASLKNGMDTPPPVPAINPRRRGTRRLFGIGRSESNEYVESGRSKTPDPWSSRATDFDAVAASVHRQNTVAPSSARQRNVSSPKRGFEGSPAMQGFAFEQRTPPPPLQTSFSHTNGSSSVQHPYGYEQHAMSSPERIERSVTSAQGMRMEGGFI